MERYRKLALIGAVLLGCSVLSILIDKNVLTISGELGISILISLVLIPLGTLFLLAAFIWWRKSLKDKKLWLEIIIIVILIILAGFVWLSSLNCSSRCSVGPDMGIKMMLSAFRAEAEIFYDDNGRSYENLCSSRDVKEMFGWVIEDIRDKQGLLHSYSEDSVVCKNESQSYIVAMKLIEEKGFFCVDNTGALEVIAHVPTGTACTVDSSEF